jgi:hypothetical protein
MCGRWPCWSLLLSGLLTAAELVAPASAQPQVEASPIRMLLEKGAGRLPWIYDGIRHVELPLAEGRAVIGLSCERQTWTLFRIERNGKDVYNFRNDPSWGYQPAGPIASSRLCTDAIRVAE